MNYQLVLRTSLLKTTLARFRLGLLLLVVVAFFQARTVLHSEEAHRVRRASDSHSTPIEHRALPLMCVEKDPVSRDALKVFREKRLSFNPSPRDFMRIPWSEPKTVSVPTLLSMRTMLQS